MHILPLKIATRLGEKGSLKFMYLSLTNLCNLRCIYCYDVSSRIKHDKKIPLRILRKVASDARRLGVENVCLTGGELFLNENWYEVGKFFTEEGIKVLISTNGTLLNKETIFRVNKLNAGLQVSFDGSKETVDYITGEPGVYEKIVYSIEIIKKYCTCPPFLNAVIGKHNKDEVEFLDDFSKKHDLQIRLTFISTDITLNNVSSLKLSIEEIDELIWKVMGFRERNKNIFLNLPPLLTPDDHPRWFNPACGWAYYVAGILYNGDVTVCAVASGIPELVAGNIMERSLYDIWTSSKLFKELRKYSDKDLKGICQCCPVVQYCLGSCRLQPYLREGDFCAPLSLCEEYYQALKDRRIKKKSFPSGMLELE